MLHKLILENVELVLEFKKDSFLLKEIIQKNPECFSYVTLKDVILTIGDKIPYGCVADFKIFTPLKKDEHDTILNNLNFLELCDDFYVNLKVASTQQKVFSYNKEKMITDFFFLEPLFHKILVPNELEFEVFGLDQVPVLGITKKIPGAQIFYFLKKDFEEYFLKQQGVLSSVQILQAQHNLFQEYSLTTELTELQNPSFSLQVNNLNNVASEGSVSAKVFFEDGTSLKKEFKICNFKNNQVPVENFYVVFPKLVVSVLFEESAFKNLTLLNFLEIKHFKSETKELFYQKDVVSNLVFEADFFNPQKQLELLISYSKPIPLDSKFCFDGQNLEFTNFGFELKKNKIKQNTFLLKQMNFDCLIPTETLLSKKIYLPTSEDYEYYQLNFQNIDSIIEVTKKG